MGRSSWGRRLPSGPRPRRGHPVHTARKVESNAYIERFNRTFREEVLDQHLFARLEDVREAAYWQMLDYNEQRPHESLGDLTPADYRQQAASGSTFEVSA